MEEYILWASLTLCFFLCRWVKEKKNSKEQSKSLGSIWYLRDRICWSHFFLSKELKRTGVFLGLSGACMKQSEEAAQAVLRLWETRNSTDQQIQAVYMGLDVVCIFSRNSPEVLKFWTSCLPYNYGKWNQHLRIRVNSDTWNSQRSAVIDYSNYYLTHHYFYMWVMNYCVDFIPTFWRSLLSMYLTHCCQNRISTPPHGFHGLCDWPLLPTQPTLSQSPLPGWTSLHFLNIL